MKDTNTAYQVTSLPSYYHDPLDYYRAITNQLDAAMESGYQQVMTPRGAIDLTSELIQSYRDKLKAEIKKQKAREAREARKSIPESERTITHPITKAKQTAQDLRQEFLSLPQRCNKDYYWTAETLEKLSPGDYVISEQTLCSNTGFLQCLLRGHLYRVQSVNAQSITFAGYYQYSTKDFPTHNTVRISRDYQIDESRRIIKPSLWIYDKEAADMTAGVQGIAKDLKLLTQGDNHETIC